MLMLRITMGVIAAIAVFGSMWAALALPCWLLWWRKGEEVPGWLALGAYGLAAAFVVYWASTSSFVI